MPDNEGDFNPVDHFDFFLCTVTVDSQFTNMAICCVLGQHPPGDLDRTTEPPFLAHRQKPWAQVMGWRLGCQISGWITTPRPAALDPPPRPGPTPACITPASPACSPPSATPATRRHPFLPLGPRGRHGQKLMSAPTVTDGRQNETDIEYWQGLGCDIYGNAFFNTGKPKQHQDNTHSETGSRFPCYVPGYRETFSHPSSLARHKRAKHSETGPLRFPCDFPSCEKTFANPSTLTQHKRIKHSETGPLRFQYDVPGCRKAFPYPSALARHKQVKHSETGPLRFPCDVPGCGKAFSEMS